MQVSKLLLRAMLAFLACVALSACVADKSQTHLFKQPTKEDLDKAISGYIRIAYLYVDRKDFEHAMINIKHALDIDKYSPAANTALAVVYENQGDIDKARETYRHVLQGNSTFSEAHLRYGNFLFEQKEYAEACQQFETASSDDFFAKRAQSFYSLGFCQRTLGDTAKAEAALSRCMALDPTAASAYLLLSTMRFEQQRYPESKELFDRYYAALHPPGQPAQAVSAEGAWLGIRLNRIFGNQDAEASLAVFLKNAYPYSKEYLEYQKSLAK